MTQMKVIILALLVGSLVAISPSLAGQHYDDTLHNNLSSEMANKEVEAEQFTTQPIILGLAESQILRLAKIHLNAEDLEASSSIIKQVIDQAKAGEALTTYHAFLVFMDYKQEQARTYELSIVRKDTALVAAINLKTHEIEQKNKYQFYYETYSSEFGLPFVFHEQGPVFDQELSTEMISYMRQYLHRSAELRRGSMMHSENGLRGITEWIGGATSVIKDLTAAAKDFIAVFKSVDTKTLKEHVKGEGFKAYGAKSSYSRILGVPLSKYDSFVKSYKVQMGITKSPKEEEMSAYFEIAQYAANEWKVNEFVFGTGRKDNICDNLIITNQISYTENVVHFVTVKVNGSFELADDVLIYSHFKSKFGGFTETTTEVRENLPRDIKEDEVKAINALMILNALNIYTEKMNIPFQLPNDNPWKM